MAVRPVAKYQVRSPDVAQGDEDVPSGPVTSCSTAAAPPLRATAAPSQWEDPGRFSGTELRLLAPTVTVEVAPGPWSPTNEMVAVTGRPALLAMTTEPGAGPLGLVAPAQNHDDDSAPAGAATGTWARGAPVWVPPWDDPLRSTSPPMTRRAAMTTMTGARRTPPTSSARGGRVRAGPLVDRPPAPLPPGAVGRPPRGRGSVIDPHLVSAVVGVTG